MEPRKVVTNPGFVSVCLALVFLFIVHLVISGCTEKEVPAETLADAGPPRFEVIHKEKVPTGSGSTLHVLVILDRETERRFLFVNALRLFKEGYAGGLIELRGSGPAVDSPGDAAFPLDTVSKPR